MSDWISASLKLIAHNGTGVLVSVCAVEGSAPREIGAKMLVTPQGQTGTIGGGQLEYIAAQQARKMIGQTKQGYVFQDYPLGPLLGQCCGGHVRLLLEKIDAAAASWLEDLQDLTEQPKPVQIISAIGETYLEKSICVRGEETDGAPLVSLEDRCAVTLFGVGGAPLNGRVPWPSGARLIETLTPASLHVTVFGAGHVGRAMTRLLGALTCPVTWVDSRAHVFPQDAPAHIQTIVSDDPASCVTAAPPSSAFYVFTHSHQLDFDITAEILARGDFFYCGLIGSKTKRARFEHRFRARGLDDDVIARLTCPIGGAARGGKAPALIALAALAELAALTGGAS